MGQNEKMKKTILFVKTGCPWCIDALAYFESKQVKLDIIDVRADGQRMDELVATSGQTKTPTLKHGDFVVADFDLEELEAALAKNPEAKTALGL
ncbi:MAG: NrdH-redoxin [Opitutae bacterium]|nr:NrdH-redoxin [Opitutae bacterium]